MEYRSGSGRRVGIRNKEQEKVKKFYYVASRDIVSTSLGTVCTIIGFFIAMWLLSWLDQHMVTISVLGLYVLIALPIIGACIFSIYSQTHKYLEIGPDEIIYHKKWFSKTKTVIPSNRIRSYSYYAGPLQTICNTSTISITTAGDGPEIVIYNIGNGEEAISMIRNLVKANQVEYK